MSAPASSEFGLHVMAKPIGPICNLDCAYCYYLGKESLFPAGEKWRMPEATLEAYIRQYIEAQPPNIEEITFAWQGGEPTLLGMEFFQRVVELQRQYAPAGKPVRNSLQTNGVTLDDAWCAYFRQHNFLIGISIDGPAELHDPFRYDKLGRPTHHLVVRGLKLLQTHGVEYNALVVVNRHNGNQGRRVYRYLRDLGVRFMQFIPIVEKLDGSGQVGPMSQSALPIVRRGERPEELVSQRSVQPEQFGRFLIEVFDDWLRRDVGRVFVQIFDEALAAWMGLEPSLCVFRKQCGRALALEHNGDLYSCDHFVEPAWRLGNIHELPIVELAGSQRQRQFGIDKEATLPQYCRQCDVRFVCNGECPKNRFIRTPDGEAGLNYLCAGYKLFFRHIDEPMRMMRDALRAGRPAAGVMAALDDQRRSSNAASGAGRQLPQRNARCHCGSGRKFKQCCGRK